MPFRKKKSPVGQLVDQAIDQASAAVDAALPVIESAVTTVREQVRELSKDAAEKAAPLVAESKALAGEIAEATKEVAIPKAKASALASADKAAELASAGRDLAAAKVAEVKGEPPKKKGGKLRKVIVFGSLAAAAGFVVSKLRGNKQADNWQSSYTPPTSTTSSTTPAPAASVPTTGGTHLAPGVGPDEPVGVDDPMAARAEEIADDPAGASPDEALADAVEEPHEVTTPDDPAEVVDVEPEAPKKK